MAEEDRKDGDNQASARAPAPAGQKLPSAEFREPVPEGAEEEVNLRDYLDVIFRRKWLVMAFLFLTFISTLIFTLTSEKIFKANGSIEVRPQAAKVTKFEDVVAQKLKDEEFFQTQVSLLQSKSLAKRVVEKLNLAERRKKEEDEEKGLFSGIKGYLASLFPEEEGKEEGNPVAKDLITEQELIGYFQENLEASPQRDSMIIDISFTSSNRHLSQDAVNTLMGQFIEWKMDQRLEASKQARRFLMKQINQAKINLEKAEEKQNRFARKTGIVSLDSRLNRVYRQLEEFNSALAKAKSDLIGKKILYQQASKGDPSSLPQVLESKMISELKSEYAGLRSRYEDLTVIFHEDYPKVKALKTRMESIKERIDNESEKIYLSIKHRYEAALNRVKNLEKQVEEQKALAMELNDKATQYKIMAREVETNKAIYQSLLERAKEIESMVGVSPSNVQIVDQASLPIFPYKPKVKRNLLLAVVVGLMGGIGLAFLVEYLADTITDPEQISERFQVPILGVVPLVKEAEYSVDKAFVSDPRAPISEALRTTKISIQLSASDSHTRSFVISSTAPLEGKTTMAANLAMAFAAAGERVLLVDADLRNPRLHKVFSIESEKTGRGLSNFLAGVIKDGFIYSTEIENVSLAPAGPIPPNPVELLASDRFTQFLEQAGKEYDRVILDAPPHQGFADLLVLSRKVGGVVLVTTAGQTTRNALRYFKRGMANVNATVLGCIVNKLNLTTGYGYRPYYKYYGAYYYYYGDGGKEKKRKKLSEG